MPRRLDEFFFKTVKIARSLHKPGLVSESLNLTLTLTGTDRAFTTWSVVNAKDLEGWIQLPRTTEELSADAVEIQIPIKFSAAGLRERTQAYYVDLVLVINSAITQEVTVRVLLSICIALTSESAVRMHEIMSLAYAIPEHAACAHTCHHAFYVC